MSTDVRLDRNRIAELEPSEGDEREQMMLSPFAVPRGMVIRGTPTGLMSVKLEYSGGEGGDYTEPLDDLSDPAVSVIVSKVGRKVLELQFNPPVRAAQLVRVADRLERRSFDLKNTAQRLSYRMTAGVIKNILVAVATDLERLQSNGPQVASRT